MVSQEADDKLSDAAGEWAARATGAGGKEVGGTGLGAGAVAGAGGAIAGAGADASGAAANTVPTQLDQLLGEWQGLTLVHHFLYQLNSSLRCVPATDL